MNKKEQATIAVVANDVKWIVRTMKERNDAVDKKLDIHDRRITSASRRTWVILGVLIATSALLGNGTLIR
ncbi:hypothetical protein LCGC14_1150360 [marine sediment metagenome]|uniref:Uncharacterized protein n=1 Tax=marine sediment metagenome TaxID=412755 RepID=A0A0F9LVM5_9ZZZZ